MRAIGIAVLLLIVACHSEPDFDERYDAAGQEIRARAEAIDAQLEQPSTMQDEIDSGLQATDGTNAPQPEN